MEKQKKTKPILNPFKEAAKVWREEGERQRLRRQEEKQKQDVTTQQELRESQAELEAQLIQAKHGPLVDEEGNRWSRTLTATPPWL